MLPLCYTGDLLSEDKSTHVTNCLINIAGKLWFHSPVSSIFYSSLFAFNFLPFLSGIYGEHFVVLQYLPQISELITVCKRSKMTQALEAGLIGYISFFKYVISFLSVDTLKNLMQVCAEPCYLKCRSCIYTGVFSLIRSFTKSYLVRIKVKRMV